MFPIVFALGKLSRLPVFLGGDLGGGIQLVKRNPWIIESGSFCY